MSFECSPAADLATCESFGLHQTPLPISTNDNYLGWICSALLPPGRRILRPIVLLKPRLTQQVMKIHLSALPAMEGMRSTPTSLAAKSTKEKSLQQRDLLNQHHQQVHQNLQKEVPLPLRRRHRRRSLRTSPRFANHRRLPIPGKSAKLMFLIVMMEQPIWLLLKLFRTRKNPRQHHS